MGPPASGKPRALVSRAHEPDRPPAQFEADAEDLSGAHPLFANAPRSVEFNKPRKRLIRNMREAIDKFGMARAGSAGWSPSPAARTATACWRCCSTSNGAACCQSSSSPATSIRASPTSPSTSCPEWLTANGIVHRIEYQDTYSIVTDKLPQGATYCSLCSRLQARQPLSHRPRGRLLGAGARPPPRGQPRNLLHEPVPRRQAGRHAAAADER